jgi:hypothetical protein
MVQAAPARGVHLRLLATFIAPIRSQLASSQPSLNSSALLAMVLLLPLLYSVY